LFLDELTEFRSDTIDALRQPLEDKYVSVTRIDGNYRFPADFMLVGAANRCKCGYFPDRTRCNCSEADIKKYLSRISGPIMDRIDICVDVPTVKPENIGLKGNYTNEKLKETVERVVNIQRERFKNSGIMYNSQMTKRDIEEYAHMSKQATEILGMAYDSLKLSMRSYYKSVKVARTIADIENAYYIEERHILEALGYRVDDAFKC